MTILQMNRGDDKKYQLTVYDKKTRVAQNITGATIKFTARETFDDDDKFLDKSFTPTNPSQGLAELTIDAADTSSLDNEKHEYVFDVEIETAGGKKETLLIGTLVVFPDVTY